MISLKRILVLGAFFIGRSLSMISLKRVLVAISIGLLAGVTIVNTAAIYVHNNTLQRMIQNQKVLEQNVLQLESNSEADYRALWDLHRRVGKLEQQTDMMVAAARSSWKDAYKLMRSPEYKEILDAQ